jgi:hypothetical protein
MASRRAGIPSTRRAGIKGKDLFLLNVMGKRTEYPDLKRAVREQCEAFEVSVA